MIAILWRYRVRPERVTEFEETYRADGAWGRLFRRAPGYLGTELLRDDAGHYLTIDRWRDAADFADFLARHRADYDALDRRCDGWTLEETKLGVFTLRD